MTLAQRIARLKRAISNGSNPSTGELLTPEQVGTLQAKLAELLKS